MFSSSFVFQPVTFQGLECFFSPVTCICQIMSDRHVLSAWEQEPQVGGSTGRTVTQLLWSVRNEAVLHLQRAVS